MASRIEGTDGAIARFLQVPKVAKELLGEALQIGGEEIQQAAVDFVPRDTGEGAETLADPTALKVDREKLRIEYGLVTPELRKRGWYLSFVEFGTKGYKAGERRISGRTKPGNLRLRKGEIVSRGGTLKLRKVYKNVPARPARPFLRPALDINLERLRDLHRKALDGAVRLAWKSKLGNVLGRIIN